MAPEEADTCPQCAAGFGPRPHTVVYERTSHEAGNHYATRRRWQREEAAERAQYRPLRNHVNAILKETGIPHSETHATRIRGWHNWNAGWTTESHTSHSEPGIMVDLTFQGSTIGSRPVAGSEEWPAKVVAALKAHGLVVEQQMWYPGLMVVDGVEVRQPPQPQDKWLVYPPNWRTEPEPEVFPPGTVGAEEAAKRDAGGV